MSDNKTPEKKQTFSPDWLLRGVLTKLGDTFDKLTGRGWKPSSSLATSELIARLKKLLDSEVKHEPGKGSFVPHHIKLKMQWNKFSTDSPDNIKKLENELLIAAIDHINDQRYHTYKPINIEVKNDYFTEGVKFLAGFDEFDAEEKEINVTIPQMNVQELLPEAPPEPDLETFAAEFSVGGKAKLVELKFKPGQRISVGRTKENDLSIDNVSVSKTHATLILNPENQLLVADTGSTNGTFINEVRIAYGKAIPISESDKLKFGTVDVVLRRLPKQTDFATREEYEIETMPVDGLQNQAQENVDELTSESLGAGRTSEAVSPQMATQPDIKESDPFSKTIAVSPAAEITNVNPPAKKTEVLTGDYIKPTNQETLQYNSAGDYNIVQNDKTVQDFKTTPDYKPEQHNEVEKNPELTENSDPQTYYQPAEKQQSPYATQPQVKLNFDEDEKK